MSVPEIDADKFVLVMEIHSHNYMDAFFSDIDNKDEKATRLYTVIGRIDKLFPDVKTRASVGGNFIEVNPSDVFEGITAEFPDTWKDAVTKKYQEGAVL